MFGVCAGEGCPTKMNTLGPMAGCLLFTRTAGLFFLASHAVFVLDEYSAMKIC